jgi:hypothetical protein
MRIISKYSRYTFCPEQYYYLSDNERNERDRFLKNGTRTYARPRSEEDYKIMPFGAHKGQSFDKLPISYMRYLINNGNIVFGPLKNVLYKAMNEKIAESNRKYYEKENRKRECMRARDTLRKVYGNTWIHL